MGDRAQARKLVLASVLVMLGAVIARALKGEVGEAFPRLWALAVVAIALGFVADFAPMIGGPLALLVALSYLTSGGREAIGRAIQTGLGARGQRLQFGLFSGAGSAVTSVGATVARGAGVVAGAARGATPSPDAGIGGSAGATGSGTTTDTRIHTTTGIGGSAGATG